MADHLLRDARLLPAIVSAGQITDEHAAKVLVSDAGGDLVRLRAAKLQLLDDPDALPAAIALLDRPYSWSNIHRDDAATRLLMLPGDNVRRRSGLVVHGARAQRLLPNGVPELHPSQLEHELLLRRQGRVGRVRSVGAVHDRRVRRSPGDVIRHGRSVDNRRAGGVSAPADAARSRSSRALPAPGVVPGRTERAVGLHVRLPHDAG